MLQNTKHGSQDHAEILETKASTLEDCQWMTGWIARNASRHKTYGSQDHGMDTPDTKASKPREDCKSLRVSWLRGWIARNASKHKTWFAGSQGDSVSKASTLEDCQWMRGWIARN